MLNAVQIADSIYWNGANDRSSQLFENLWPLPNGVSLNSYLIKDEKNVLIDTIEPSKVDNFLKNIKLLLNEGETIDYLVINHMEPDHSGGISAVVKQYPDLKIIANKRTLQLLESFYGITDNILIINDRDEISIGKYTLQFHITPWLHWPETMMTYVKENGILFSGDAFGSFGALDGGIVDEELNINFYEEEMLRYFTNIMAQYSGMIEKALIKIAKLQINMIASTHGPIWKKYVKEVFNKYLKWSTFEADKGVVIVYGTMYGGTEKLAETIARRLSENGIREIKVINSATKHISFLLPELWKYKGIILGSCAYNSGIFTPMENILAKIEHISLGKRKLGIFGSYSWNGGGVKTIRAFAEKTDWTMVGQPIETKGQPNNEIYEACNKLADEMAQSLNEEN